MSFCCSLFTPFMIWIWMWMWISDYQNYTPQQKIKRRNISKLSLIVNIHNHTSIINSRTRHCRRPKQNQTEKKRRKTKWYKNSPLFVGRFYFISAMVSFVTFYRFEIDRYNCCLIRSLARFFFVFIFIFFLLLSPLFFLFHHT